MQIRDGSTLYSASDLVSFLECKLLTGLDFVNLETPLPKAPVDDRAKLMQDKVFELEEAYLANLQAASVDVIDVRLARLVEIL